MRTESTLVDKEIKISVIVAVYNPEIKKLLKTLYSIIIQKNIRFEIIISDDGTKEDNFEIIKNFFEYYKFKDFSIVKSNTNRGTVLNVLAGVNIAKGGYVKIISPGDYLFSYTTLSEWYDSIQSVDSDMSFGDVVYYRSKYGNAEIIKFKTSPQYIKPYVRHKEKTIIKNMLLLNDTIHGVSYICKKNVLRAYLEEIKGKVIYSEDLMIKLMAFDRCKISYFNSKVVFYEYGFGISTVKNDFWREKINADLREIDILLTKRKKNYYWSQIIRDSIIVRNTSDKITKWIVLLKYPDVLIKRIKFRFCKRYTETKFVKKELLLYKYNRISFFGV